MPQTATDSVKFYTLSSMPNIYKKGAFLNLTQDDHDNKEGLYFCDGTRWRYLIHTEVQIQSAGIYNNTMYFYTTPTAPDFIDGSDSDSEPDLGDYVFSVQLPELVGGNGVSVSDFYNIDVDLANFSVYESTNVPHIGTENLLTIDIDSKLTIGDTWRCGVYHACSNDGSESESDSEHYGDGNMIKRHVSHLLTESVVYKQILKKEVPDGVVPVPVSFVPSHPNEFDYEYIKKLTTPVRYFQLVGKKPEVYDFLEGEITISTAKGFERLYIKNNQDEIVEFRPSGRLNEVYNATFTNDALTVDTATSTCVWEIPYSDIISEGIGIYGAVVFLRENQTGKQLIPDVVFDGTNSKVVITMYSTTNIAAGRYTAIVMGSNYNNTHQ